jgi:DNA (cytosine-5)-methyltransferase 1
VLPHDHAHIRHPVAIDLFSGCGGLTEGLEQAGFAVKGAVEIDPLAVETYQANHTAVKVWNADITTLSVEQVMQHLGLKKGELDLLAGCPPCQGFSSMRTLNGSRSVTDPRNDLVRDFFRFVEGLRPKAVMMENVPGLQLDRRMDEFITALARLGYHIDKHSVRICNVADFGVPQRRRRLMMMVSLTGPVPFAPPDPIRRKVRDAIGDLPQPGGSGDALHDLVENRSKRICDLIQKIKKDGGSRTEFGKTEQLACHQKCDGFKDVYGRMAWDSVAPTITGGCVNPSKGRFLHPVQNRAITLREAALLQSFPKQYTFSLKRGKFAAAALIGNALPPEFVRRHAVSVARYLGYADDLPRVM